VRTHANHSLPHPVSDQTRTTEIADLLARLAALLSEHSPDTEKPTPQPVPVRVLLTVEEAAQRLHLGKTTTYALLRAGEIESVRIGRLRRIPVDAINSYAARLARGQATARKAA
jgi:excisionase family DNA binding protein